MKKRVISLLLCLCLAAGLFAGLGATAYADGDTQTHTVTKDDAKGLADLCARLGVDFEANKDWIRKTNNLNGKYELSIGKVLTLPAAGKVLTYVAPTSAASTVGTTTAATTTATTTTTNGVSTFQYTLKSGDFVINICNALGIDFAANQEWIKAANNITNFNNLKVGRVLTLPAPGTTPALSTITTTTTAANTVAATTLAATTTTGTNLQAGDTVKYYLVSYVVRSGDTLGNICSYFGASLDTVQALNNIANAARISVGQVLKVPSYTAPSSGSYTAIVAHNVVSGDTVGALCTKYGISYEANAATIKSLNNNANLNVIRVGQTLLFPVPSTVATAIGTTTVGTTTAATATATSTIGNKYYTFNRSNTVNGTYSLTVNGQSVNGASAGQTVHIVAMADYGYKLGAVSVVREGISTAVAVDANNNFVMPAGNVNISVSFVVDEAAQPHLVYNSSVTNKNVIAVVNGVVQTSVAPGQAVRLVLSDLPTGAVVEKIAVSTVNPTDAALVRDNKIEAKDLVSLAADYSFVMPSSNVYVTVLLKTA